MSTKEVIGIEFIKILFGKECIHQIMGNQITIKQQKLHKLDSLMYECYILHKKLTLAFDCFIYLNAKSPKLIQGIIKFKFLE